MSITKDLICLANIEKSFEILETLRFLPGNESLQDLWGNLLEIRSRQVSILKEHDNFGFINTIKKTNTSDISIQCTIVHTENIKSQQFNHSYK